MAKKLVEDDDFDINDADFQAMMKDVNKKLGVDDESAAMAGAMMMGVQADSMEEMLRQMAINQAMQEKKGKK